MASRRTKFAIGLFVLSGLLIGAIIIIWAGASDMFLKGLFYNVYFDESVQGLQVDSAVKYRGVEIGKVESIKVAPDDTLIEVAMKIDLPSDLQKNTYAQLRTAGITGIVFIELNRISPDIVVDIREVPFSSDYPIIPSRRSETSRFLTDVDILMQNIKAIDFKGISEQLKDSTRAVATFLTGERLNRAIANLESASRNLDKSVVEIQKKIDEVEIEGIVKEIYKTLSEARGFIQSARQEMEAIKLAEQTAKAGEVLDTLAQQTAKTGEKAGEIMDELGKSSDAIALELRDASENLRLTSEHLQALAEGLKNNPSELIFSRPAPPRKQME
jgi:phospholipid/cholesterol/gamma-HCH transport system substrate-binding protein